MNHRLRRHRHHGQLNAPRGKLLVKVDDRGDGIGLPRSLRRAVQVLGSRIQKSGARHMLDIGPEEEPTSMPGIDAFGRQSRRLKERALQWLQRVSQPVAIFETVDDGHRVRR